jgi:hypothetical protein
MNEIDENVEKIINNEYDYSNVIPVEKIVSYLVQYFDNIYNQFIKLIEEDENKNEKIKYEYQNYKYKKSFSTSFKISIQEKNFNIININNYDSYISILKSEKIKNINSLKLELILDYRTGSNDKLINHDNSFIINFKPYDIIFVRKSNHNESIMNNIENNINNIFNKFPIENTIFCSK